MLVKTHCAAVMGLEAVAVTIEVNIARGTMLHLSGLADTAVRESIDRIRAALSNTGYKFPTAEKKTEKQNCQSWLQNCQW